MPGTEDKVVLQVAIDVADSKKEFGKFSNVLKGVAKQTSGMTDASDKAMKKQIRTAQELGKAHKEATNAAVQGERKKQREADRTTDSLKKQAKEAKRTGGLFEKMGKGMQRFMQSKQVKRFGREVDSAISKTGRAGMSMMSGLWGFVMGGIQGAYSQYLQYGAQMAQLTGTGATRAGLRGAQKAGVGMGFRPTQTLAHMAAAGRAVGLPGGGATTAQRFALAGGGMQVGEAVGIMGGLRQAGVTFGGQSRAGGGLGTQMIRQQRQGAKELSRLIEGGLISGLERARLPEYLQGVSQIAEQVGGRQAGRVDVRGIGARMALLGQVPGMQGRRAMQMGARLDQMIRAPGGGEAGQQLMLQAMGFGKPGGSVSFYEATKRQQRGFFGKGGGQNLIDVFKEVTQQYGVAGAGGTGASMEEANLVLSQISGLTLDQVESMQEIMNSGVDQKEKLRKITELMDKSQPIEKQSLTALKKGFSGTAKYLAGLEATNIKIGGRMAKTMMKLQKFQLKALDVLSNYLPKIFKQLEKIAGFIYDIYLAIKSWLPKGAKERVEEAKQLEGKVGATIIKEAKRRGIEKIGTQTVTDLLKRSRIMARAARAGRSHAAEMRSTGTFGDKEQDAIANQSVRMASTMMKQHEGYAKRLQRVQTAMSKAGYDPAKKMGKELQIAVRNIMQAPKGQVHRLLQEMQQVIKGTKKTTFDKKMEQRLKMLEKIQGMPKLKKGGKKTAMATEEEGPTKLASAEQAGRRKIHGTFQVDAPTTKIPYGGSAGRTSA